MLGKRVNGVLVTPSESEFKKIVITNPSEELLKFVMGYKDLAVDEQPEVEDGQILVPTYEETETAILQHWDAITQEEYEARLIEERAKMEAEMK